MRKSRYTEQQIALCPFASSTSACRSLRMICSGVWRF
jgi:hypothetical protein